MNLFLIDWRDKMKLYKYMQYRPEFFNNFLIRLTPFNDLNDPFEGSLSFEYYEKFLSENFSNNFNLEEIYGITLEDYEEIGIISLTEDPANILMWSHYADEYKGLVVEFSFEKDNQKNLLKNYSFPKKDVFGIETFYPKKVHYSNYRFGIVFPEEIKSEKFEYPLKRFNERFLFTKANDWMYEKEYRIVMQLKKADVILIKENIEDVYNELISLKNVYEYCKKFIKKDENKLIIEFPDNFETDFLECGDEYIRNEIYILVRHYNPLYFLKINKDSITKIIFGYRFDNDEIENIRNSNNKFEYYKVKPSMLEYKLEFEKLKDKK